MKLIWKLSIRLTVSCVTGLYGGTVLLYSRGYHSLALRQAVKTQYHTHQLTQTCVQQTTDKVEGAPPIIQRCNIPVRKVESGYSKPPSKQHCAPQDASEYVASVDSRQDGHRPLLPLAVPVQGDGHGTEPGAEEPAQQPTKRLVERGPETGDGSPGARVDAMRVEQREGSEEGQVGCAEEGVGDVGEQGRPEEDHGDVEERRQDQ